ncbi:MAG: IS200/IS605 family transposase [Chitinophagales bacterium]
MANTYTQIHIQVVFTVKNRESFIRDKWKDELYKYITGIIQNHGHKLLQINGTSDDIHILIGMRPTQSLSDLIKQVKQDSSLWINKKRLIKSKFSWQAGYGAFSYSRDAIPNVIRYIKNQEQHHKQTSFLEEYKKILNEFNVEYNEDYLFKPIE